MSRVTTLLRSCDNSWSVESSNSHGLSTFFATVLRSGCSPPPVVNDCVDEEKIVGINWVDTVPRRYSLFAM
jgi:hypothetical protein